jgi:hypothetical protein
MACAAQGPLGETGDYRSRIIRVLAGPGGEARPESGSAALEISTVFALEPKFGLHAKNFQITVA